MDLARLILLRLETATSPIPASAFSGEGYDVQTVAYHYHLLEQAGYITANLFRLEGRGAIDGTAESLTWQGHEFLDAARNDSVWHKTMAFVKEKGGSIPFDILKGVLLKYSATHFGLPGS